MDTIERQAAIDLIERMKPYQLDGDDCIEIIANMPSAQPEIIECKECRCFEIAKNEVNGFCTKHGICPDVYDFCSMAERRTDGDQ